MRAKDRGRGRSLHRKPILDFCNMTTSNELFERAKRVIPGGVNSPVRAFGSVGGTPVFYESGQGARLRDVEGKEYIDCVGSWGPLILGHRAPAVEAAIEEALRRGTTFGAPTEREVELAEAIVERVPGVETVRLTSSGTEACLSAIRLARGVTGRPRIVKFEGCYHGHADSFLIKAGSGGLTFGAPSSPGVPEALAELTITTRFNDLESVRTAFQDAPGQIAAVILEPIAGNMGCVPPLPGFLTGLRDLCSDEGAMLVVDEVMTGFRIAPGGAQEYYGVEGDIVTMGKVVGGGMPLAAFGGRRELFERLAPEGPIYQAGTLSGNPLATAAGLATLRELADPDVYTELEAKGARLEGYVQAAIERTGTHACYQRVGSMATLFFCNGPVESLDSLANVDTARFGRFFHALLKRGVAFPPSQYEAFFLSLAHTDSDLQELASAIEESIVESAS